MNRQKFVWVFFAALVGLSVVASRVEAQGTPGSSAIVVVQEGEGWKVVNVRGWASEEGRQFDQNLILISGARGAKAAPLPAIVGTDAIRAAGAENSMLVVDQATVKEIAASLRLGQLTAALTAVALPEDPAGSSDPRRTSCPNTAVTKSKSVSLEGPLTLANRDFGGGFSGTLNLSGNLHGSGTAEIQVQVLSSGIFGVCIPYGVQFDHTRAYGNLSVGYSATLTGTVNYANPRPWEREIAKPNLGSISFFAGPVPVLVGFNLPITAGLELSSSVAGSVSYSAGQQIAQGQFDYTCSLSGCSGRTNFSQTSGGSPQGLSGSVSGHVKPSIYAQGALRAYLYLESVAYAQVGVRPYLHGDLWGHHGNDCGDADGDGRAETVNALTFDLDWQLRVTAQASAFGQQRNWDNLWSSSYRHMGFWDVLGRGGSQAMMQPMLGAQNPVRVSTSQRYDAKMRSCWPYSDTIRYGLTWGDGTSAALSGVPQTTISAYKTWTTQGQKAVALTAVSDSHGRNLNATTNRSIQVTPR